MCPCGFLMPTMALPDSESTKMVLYYIIHLMDGYPYQQPRREHPFIIVFDDACHLYR